MITSATEFLAVFAIHPALIAAMSRAANTSRTCSRRKNIDIPYSPLSALQITFNPPYNVDYNGAAGKIKNDKPIKFAAIFDFKI